MRAGEGAVAMSSLLSLFVYYYIIINITTMFIMLKMKHLLSYFHLTMATTTRQHGQESEEVSVDAENKHFRFMEWRKDGHECEKEKEIATNANTEAAADTDRDRIRDKDVDALNSQQRWNSQVSLSLFECISIVEECMKGKEDVKVYAVKNTNQNDTTVLHDFAETSLPPHIKQISVVSFIRAATIEYVRFQSLWTVYHQASMAGWKIGDGHEYGVDFLFYPDDRNRVHSNYGVVVRMKRCALLSQEQNCTPTMNNMHTNTNMRIMALDQFPESMRDTDQTNKSVRHILVLPNFDDDLPSNVLTPDNKNFELVIQEKQQPLSLLDRIVAMRLLNSVRKQLLVATVTFPSELECIQFHQRTSNSNLDDYQYNQQLENQERYGLWENVKHSSVCMDCMSCAAVHYTTVLPVRLSASMDKQSGER